MDTPQLPPLETENWSMDSSPPPPQLRLSSESRSTGGSSTSTPPQLPRNSNDLQQQAEPYTWTTATRVRREDGTIQLPPKFNLQAMKSLQRPPLGLKFEITPELVAKLTRAPAPTPPKKAGKAPSSSTIPATSISIGPNWRRESRREDDLTLKLYFAKKKLIWEFLEGSLKEKIQVSWSDITAIHAHIPDNQPGILLIKLGNNTPSFFREAPPKPLKHTIWQPTHDFTHGQAACHRIFETEFAHGALDAHYTKLLQSDQRLLELSRKPFPYPTPTQAQQQQQHQQSLSVNNPTPSAAAAAAAQSHLNPIPSFTAVGVGESSRNANQYQTPLLMPSMSSQQLPFNLTGVEQSWLYNNPTPSLHMQGESSSSSSRNADHHHLALGDDSAQIGGHHSSFVYNASFLDSSQLLQDMSYNQPLLHQDQLNQFQNNSTHSHINNVPANTYSNNLYGHVQQPTMEMENTALHHQHNTAARATSPGGETAPEEYWPQLDGNNNSMDLYDLYKFHTGQRGPY